MPLPLGWNHSSHRCYFPIQTTHIILRARRHSITKEICAVKEAAVSHLTGLMDAMIRLLFLDSRSPGLDTIPKSFPHIQPTSSYPAVLWTRALLTGIDFLQQEKFTRESVLHILGWTWRDVLDRIAKKRLPKDRIQEGSLWRSYVPNSHSLPSPNSRP